MKLKLDKNTEPLKKKIEKLIVMLKDSDGPRCGCRNTVFDLVREYGGTFVAVGGGGFSIGVDNYVECEKCGASWTWGEA